MVPLLYMLGIGSIVALLALLLLKSRTTAQPAREGEEGGDVSGPASTLTMSWSAEVICGPYNLSQLTFDDRTPGVELAVRLTEGDGWQAEAQIFDQAVEEDAPFFYVCFGWSPRHFFAQLRWHPANFVVMEVTKVPPYRYTALNDHNEFALRLSSDAWGYYLELATGQVALAPDNAVPVGASGSVLSVTLHYRCPRSLLGQLGLREVGRL